MPASAPAPNKVNIEGSRIRLRDWLLEDLEGYFHWQSPGHTWQKFDGPYYQVGLTTTEARRTAEALRENIEANDFPEPRMGLAIADSKTNKLMGRVGSYWESIETHWLCLGIILYEPKDWGQGLGFEVLSLWIDYLFEKYPETVRLDLRTWSGNAGMMKLAVKLGFQQEACFRKARIVEGVHFDALGYGILREEWLQRRA